MWFDAPYGCWEEAVTYSQSCDDKSTADAPDFVVLGCYAIMVSKVYVLNA